MSISEGNRRADIRQYRLDPVDRVDDVGARLAIEHDDHRGAPVGDPSVAQILDRIDDIRDIRQADRGAVAIGDHQRAIGRSLVRLVVGVELPAPLVVLDRALWAVRVGGVEGGAHVLEADRITEERVRVELDAHRGQGAAADRHLTDAVDLRQFLLQHRRGGIIELAGAARLRGQRQHQDRGTCGVDLVIARIALETDRQVGARGIDCRLHVAGGTVDVAVEAELEHDARIAAIVRRSHLADVGDLREMALQRRGDARRHDLRARAGELRLDDDRREIDLRQQRHRQQKERDHSRKGRSECQYRRRHRPPDGELGEVHRCVPRPTRSPIVPPPAEDSPSPVQRASLSSPAAPSLGRSSPRRRLPSATTAHCYET